MIERALEMVGNHHTFQYLLLVFLFACCSISNLLILSPTFTLMNPLFECSFVEGYVTQAIACSQITSCKIYDNFTIVSYVGLFCEFQLERNYIQSSLSIGCCCGLFVVNTLADFKGRRYSLLFVLVLGFAGVIFTLIGTFFKSILLLILSQFLCGFVGLSLNILAYLLPTDYCELELQRKSIKIIMSAWSLTTIVTGICYLNNTQWSHFLTLTMLLPMIILFFITYFFFLEAPSFLFEQRRMADCLQVLQKIGSYNKKSYNMSQLKELMNHENSTKNVQNFWYELQDKTILKKLLILTLIQIGANVYYCGSNYALDQVGLNYGTNMIITGLVQLLSSTYLIFFSDIISERKGILLFYSCAFVLSLLFIINSLSKSNQWTIIILSLIRFLTTIAFSQIMILVILSFPSKIKSTCVGIVEGLASFGCFIAPFALTIGINQQIHPALILSPFIPFLILIPTASFKQTSPTNQDIEKSILMQQMHNN